MVSVSVRLLIAATVRSGSVETPLSTAARDVFEGKVTTAAQLKEQLRQLTPGDAQFREAFERARVSTAKLGRYYLRSLERAAKIESDPWFIPEDDRNKISLEHVLPLNPDGNWEGVSEEDAAQYAKRFGNMVLMRVGDNSALKSAPFVEKKVVYAESPYLLTNQVSEAKAWTSNEIVERQKRLAELAVKAWPAT